MNIFLPILLTFAIFTFEFHQVACFGTRQARSSTCVQTESDGQFLKDIFIGRCYYFYNILQRDNCNIIGRNYNCSKIWLKFEEIMLKASCQVSDFDTLFYLTDHDIPENKSVFWSGTPAPTHQYTKAYQYWSLEDTFNGYLLDDLTFCKSASGQIIYNASCGSNCAFRTYWSAASKNFASKASGLVTAVLNGSRSNGAVANTSTFYNYELPYLNFQKIKKFTVLLLHTPGAPIVETCENGRSLIQLQKTLTSKNVTFECIDNPQTILFYMCFLDPLSKECQSIKFALNPSVKQIPNLLILIFGVVSVFTVLF